MNGGWASALGAAILGGNQSYQGALQRRQLQQQQQFENDRLTANDAQNAKLQALQMAITQSNLDELPAQKARQRYTDAVNMHGSGAFDMPEVLDAAKTAGIPLRQFPPVYGPVQGADETGISPNTNVQVPQSVMAGEASAQMGARKSALELNKLANAPSPLQEHQWKIEENAARSGSGNSAVASAYTAQRQQRVLDMVDGLLPQVNGWTTGIGGAVLSHIPATDAKDFGAKLDALKSNIMQTELTEMRMASKTGGALGNVSDREGANLASALGALEQAQSPQQMRDQLLQIQQSVRNYQAEKANPANRAQVQQLEGLLSGGAAPQTQGPQDAPQTQASAIKAGDSVSYAEVVRRTQGTNINPQQMAAQLKAAGVVVTK